MLILQDVPSILDDQDASTADKPNPTAATKQRVLCILRVPSKNVLKDVDICQRIEASSESGRFM